MITKEEIEALADRCEFYEPFASADIPIIRDCAAALRQYLLLLTIMDESSKLFDFEEWPIERLKKSDH